MSRRKKPTTFASPERMAANFVLQDYDVAEPWKLLVGREGQQAIDGAEEIEEVGITEEHACLSDTMVIDANNFAFVFVRDYLK